LAHASRRSKQSKESTMLTNKRPITWMLAVVAFALLPACAGTPGAARTDGAAGGAVPAAVTHPCALPASDRFWQAVSPAAQGFMQDKLCRTLQEIAGGPDNVHSILIERHGNLLAELYRTGKDTPISAPLITQLLPAASTSFTASTLHDARSVSKSVIGLLTGITIQRGALRLEDRVLDHFPELSELRTRGREDITVRHLLTMSAGLDWQEIRQGWLTSNETPLLWRKAPAKYYFDRPLTSQPGTMFNYAGGATMVLAELLVRANAKPLEQLVKEDLFGPLGIDRWEWATNLRGLPMAYAGLRIRPRDMLKLGRLVNNRGRWQGRQVVPEAWIEDTLKQHVPANLGFMGLGGEVGYGYQWWNGTVDWHGKILAWSAAIGNGGQRILVVPSLDVTIVVTAGDYGSPTMQKTVGQIVVALLDALNQ
jgi:CubicO group peptidase (beta-lactamase class C family)